MVKITELNIKQNMDQNKSFTVKHGLVFHIFFFNAFLMSS